MSTDSLLSGAGRRLRVQARQSRYYSDPALWARECIQWPEGQGLADYQAAILTTLARDHRVAVRAPHGSGKTSLSALALLWFSLTRNGAGVSWKALLTAGAWRQLEHYLLPEVHLWAKRVRWDVVGRRPFDERTELLTLNLKLAHGAASAGASDDSHLLEGMHADSVLVILDESKSIGASVFDAVEGALSGQGETFALAASTPGPPSGRFYQIHQRQPGLSDWSPIHVSLAQAIEAGRISREWADQRALQWGSTSAVFQNRVLGEFASESEDSIVPLAWVEAAVDRWNAWKASGAEAQGEVVIGVDPARFGEDKTAIATRQGNVVLSVERHAHEDTMVTTGRVVAKLSHGGRAVIDSIGIGAGVLDRLREQGLSAVEGFNASEASAGRDRSGELQFLNRRAAAWWSLREMLDPAYEPELCLPDDPQLLGDLCAPTWSITSSGKVQLEGKDQLRKRLGRSTDAGDAVVMALATRYSQSAVWLDSLAEAQANPQPTAHEAQLLRLRGAGLEFPFPGQPR